MGNSGPVRMLVGVALKPRRINALIVHLTREWHSKSNPKTTPPTICQLDAYRAIL